MVERLLAVPGIHKTRMGRLHSGRHATMEHEAVVELLLAVPGIDFKRELVFVMR